MIWKDKFEKLMERLAQISADDPNVPAGGVCGALHAEFSNTQKDSGCKCKICQINKKSELEQYAYYYSMRSVADIVCKQLDRAGVEQHYYPDGPADSKQILEQLFSTMDDIRLNGDAFIFEMERKNPKLIEWMKGMKK